MELTLEEQERVAYISGDVQHAALLGRLIDAEQQLDDIEDAGLCGCGCED